MDEPALRDVERWKDKIEVRLDNRQVFFLFFGSSLVACLLFVLGVLVGKRLESRGRAEAPAVEDPLALLDRVAAAPAAGGDDSLTFPRALLGSSKERAPESRPGPGAKATASKPAVAVPRAAAAAVPPSPAPPAEEPRKGGEKQLAQLEVEKGQGDTSKAGAKESSSSSTSAKHGQFTLQLSSFQDRAEAEAFARRIGDSGMYIVATELPGRGTWYRVRVGDYATAKEAADAKVAFEKKYSVIAYVALR